MKIRYFLNGILGTLALLALYISILTLVSDWQFAKLQFSQYWYYIVSLAIGFGVQVGLYSFLKGMIHKASKKVLAATGTTSTLAMISCCAHYLVNILPILGASALVTFISQYQVQFFWIGIIFNLSGIAFIVLQIKKFFIHHKEMQEC